MYFTLNKTLNAHFMEYFLVLRPPKVYSSLVIYITSHGKNGGTDLFSNIGPLLFAPQANNFKINQLLYISLPEIAATDQFWNIEELLHMFNARACGAWKDKPKIFIFDVSLTGN